MATVDLNIRITVDEPVYRDPDVQRILDVRRATVVVMALHGVRNKLHDAESAGTIETSNSLLSDARTTMAEIIGKRASISVRKSANSLRSQIICAADEAVRNAIQSQRGIGYDAGKTTKQLKIESIAFLRTAIDEVNKLV